MSSSKNKVSDFVARSVFERDDYRCRGCRKQSKSYLDLSGAEITEAIKSGTLLVIDHYEGGLQSLCWGCNSSKAGRGIYAFRLSMALRSLGRCVAYYPSLARLVGLKESIFLCQLLYWSPKGRHDKGEGWIYKTAEEMEVETGLSYKEQIRLRKSLFRQGLIEENYARSEHRLYFRVNADNLDLLGEHMTKSNVPSDQW